MLGILSALTEGMIHIIAAAAAAVVVVVIIIVLAVVLSRRAHKRSAAEQAQAQDTAVRETAAQSDTDSANDVGQEVADDAAEQAEGAQEQEDETVQADEQEEEPVRAEDEELREQEKKEPVQADEEQGHKEEPVQTEQEEPVVQEQEEPVQAEQKQEEPASEQVKQPSVRKKQSVAKKESAATVAVEKKVKSEASSAGGANPKFIDGYLSKLGEEDAESFRRVILENAEELKTRVKLPVSQYADEKAFLTDYFRSCSKYAKRVPIAVTEMLYKRNSKFITTDKDRSRAMRKMIAAYYSRRKEENTLGKCEKLCKQDAEYWLDTAGLRDKALPPLKKLIIICVSQNRFDEALALCDKAIASNIIDAKGEGYERRKEKIAQKQEKYKIKLAKAQKKKGE